MFKASGSDDLCIKIWNLDSYQCVRTIGGHDSSVQSLRLLATDRLVSRTAWDHVVRVWHVETGECVTQLVGHTNTVSCIKVAGVSVVVSGPHDNTIKVWSLDGEQNAVFFGANFISTFISTFIRIRPVKQLFEVNCFHSVRKYVNSARAGRLLT